jgi:hypothetical protein
MSGIALSDAEIEELFTLLKPMEQTLSSRLMGLLVRLEKSLYARLTVEEIEALSRRFSPGD